MPAAHSKQQNDMSRITISHRCIQNTSTLTAKDSAGEPVSVHSEPEDEAHCTGLR